MRLRLIEVVRPYPSKGRRSGRYVKDIPPNFSEIPANESL